MDWTDALATAQGESSYDQIKRDLPLTFVLEYYGLPVEVGGDGKGHTQCPFHQDSEPSFDIFGENFERWGCYPCAAGGDVFDFLRKVGALTFPEAVEKARELVVVKEASDWTGPKGAIKRTLDLASVEKMVTNSQADLTGLQNFIDARGFPFTAEQIAAAFGVGSVGSSIIAPYWTSQGELATYKHRVLGTKFMSAPGSKFDGLLYGDWRDNGLKPVLLTEGETDAWVAAYYLSSTYSVLGLPVGAGTRPDAYKERLAGRLVVLAFDGDQSGRIATRTWAAALGTNVRVVSLPAGADLASLGAGIVEAVAGHRAIPIRPQAIIENDHSTYYRVTKESQITLSNWTFQPERELTDEHGTMAYEGTVLPSGREATITSQDLSTATRTFAWAVKQGGSWLGTDKDGRTLLSQYNAEGPFLEPARMSGVAGLHDGQFIWPGGQTGARLYRWVSLGADTRLSEKVTIRQGTINVPEAVALLRSLHRQDVVDPILAWLAAAPLRSLRNQFPVLAVTGSSGTGKTTLTDVLLRFFTGTSIGTNLTGTTRYGIEALVGSTNAYPVWVDEYRPGARADTAMAFQQILRDAYTGQGSVRGGSAEAWSTVVESPVHAPLVVTGENAFEETSHIERIVNVVVAREGRNPEALQAVQDALSALEGVFAWTYLSWLTARLESLPGPTDAAQPEGYHLAPRVLTNLGILEWGWHLLERFVTEAGGELGPADFSGVIRTAEEDSQHSPIEDALVQVMGEMDSIDIIFRRTEGIGVQVLNFVRYCIRSGIPLPGNDKAIKRFLIETYGGYETTLEAGGFTKRVVMLPADSLVR
jgi:hypothetical protein